MTHLTSASVSGIDDDTARRLLWETGDHWENAKVYRHYLPRILEALAPPQRCEDLYPAHLFETLTYLRFRDWPATEQQMVKDYLRLVAPVLEMTDQDRHEWHDSYNQL
ncbi:MAG: hypothetical protein AAF581_10285 [Planctomycetota bacterium]